MRCNSIADAHQCISNGVTSYLHQPLSCHLICSVMMARCKQDVTPLLMHLSASAMELHLVCIQHSLLVTKPWMIVLISGNGWLQLRCNSMADELTWVSNGVTYDLCQCVPLLCYWCSVWRSCCRWDVTPWLSQQWNYISFAPMCTIVMLWIHNGDGLLQMRCNSLADELMCISNGVTSRFYWPVIVITATYA